MWKDAQRFLLEDKIIGPLINEFGDCTIAARDKKYYFLDLVDAIVSQQLSNRASATIFNRLKSLFPGNELDPELLLKLSESSFRSVGLSRQKISYIKDLSQKVVDNTVKVSALAEFPDEEIVKQLTLIKGIGRWTAEMFLMFSLARPDIFPVIDLGIQNALKKAFPHKKIHNKNIERIGKKWQPFRTVASWYLWRSLDNQNV